MVKSWNPIDFAKRVLRQATKKTRGYNEALKRASRREYETKKDGTPSKKYRVYYCCAMCGRKDLSRKQVEADHVVPIGLQFDLELWIRALFCNADGYQILCKDPCHKQKTKTDKKKIAIRKKALKAHKEFEDTAFHINNAKGGKKNETR